MASLLALLTASALAAAIPSVPAGEVTLAQLVIAPPAAPPLPLPDEATLALGSAHERMTVPVSIGAHGPWPFVIDTGSERTVVSRELAGVLGLAAGPQLRIIAMTGAATVGSVMVPGLSVSQILRDTIQAPALGARDLGAVGMLGIDALQGHAITIDFDKNTMSLKPSRKRASPRSTPTPGEVVVTAKSLFGQLIVTDASWRGKRIAVVIDTGSPATIGNGALLAAITKRKLIGPMRMTSAIGDTLHTTAFMVDGVEIGGIGFNGVPIAFADAPPFKRFGLGDTPALLLGMDALRLFRRVAIDFANREIRFAMPRGLADPSTTFNNR